MDAGTTPAVADNPTDWQTVQQPDDWQMVSRDLHAKAGYPTTVGTPPPTPGFISRSAEALGIPTSNELSQPVSPGEFAGHALLGPAFTAGQVAYGFGKNLVNKATEPMTPQEQADAQIHPVGQAINQGAKFILEGPLAPVGGQAVSNIANDKGNLAAQGGDVAGSLANLFLLKGAKDPKTAARIAYATAGDAQDVLKAEGDLRNAVALHGTPKDVPQLIDRIDKAKTALNKEYSNAIGPYANQFFAGVPGDPYPIATAIRELRQPNMYHTEPGMVPQGVTNPFEAIAQRTPEKKVYYTAQGKIASDQIENAAKEFEKPWTMAALDRERIDANARMHRFHKLNDVDAYAAETAPNRSLSIDKAISDTIRDSVYPFLDRVTGKPPGYFADLKQRVGALMNLGSDANAHLGKLNTKSLAMEGASPLERMRMRGMVGEGGKPRLYVTDALGKSDPLAIANSRVAGAFPNVATSAVRAAALLAALRHAAPNHPLVQPPPEQ